MTAADAPLPGTLQLWSDLSCPYATEAVSDLRDTRARLGLELDVRIEHRAFPLELASPGHPVTRWGLTAVQVARDEAVGGWSASEELDWALRRTAPDADADQVLEIARGVEGLDADALAQRLDAASGLVEREWEAAQRLGIEGSPQVRLSDGTSVFNPGTQGAEVWDDLLRRALAPEG